MFTPHRATILHDAPLKDRTVLLLRADLLELESLTNGDGTAIDLNYVVALPGGGEPAGVLILTGSALFTPGVTRSQAIEVSGTWGWHANWANAWRDSGDTVRDDPLSDSATALTVSDVAAADSDNQSPRFQTGHLLRIEEEYLRVLAVTAVSESDDLLTVARGVNGTTAAAHAQDTPVYTYQPAADIAALCQRWAAWLYREPDSRAAGTVPPVFLREVDALRRVRV
jgi:hypothetical protein